MDSRVEVLQQFYAAVNRNDMDAIGTHFDADIVRVEPPGFPTSGTYRGIDAVRAHVGTGRGSWAEGSCQPEEFFIHGDKAVVYLYAWVRLHGASDWSGGRFADGFAFSDGKIIEYRSFAERDAALQWAGLQ